MGTTYIVDNRQTAYLLTKTASENARFVTLAGEVFTGKNTVIAGETSHRTLLSRPRMMKELTTKIEELTKISSQLDSSYSKIEKELSESRQKIQNLQDIQQKNQKERERLTHRNQELTLQLGKMQQLIDWQKSQAVQSVSEHEKTLAELDVLEADLAKMMIDNAILEEQQTKILQELDSLSLDELTGQVNFWKTNLAVAQKAFQDAQRRLEEYNHLVDSNAERIAFGAERIAKLHVDIQGLEEQRSEALQVASTTSKTIATLQIDIEPNEQALNTLEQEYDQHLSNQMVLQQALVYCGKIPFTGTN